MTAPNSTIAPLGTALLLMDFQPDILRTVPNGDSLLAPTKAAADVLRRAGAQVVFVRVAFAPQDLRSIDLNNKIFRQLAAGGFLEEGTAGAEIHPDLEPAAEDIVVTKTRLGAFSTSNLATHLSRSRYDNLILAGVSTSGVVLSTLRDAADRDFRLFVLSDCCSDQPGPHEALFEHIFPHLADVLTSNDLPGLLS